HSVGGNITIQATASDSDGTVDKVEFYANEVKLGEDSVAPYTFTWSGIPEGTYFLSARAVDNTGTATSSVSHPVHINYTGSISPWLSQDIGTPGIPGHSDVTDSVYTIKSSGNIIGTADAFH